MDCPRCHTENPDTRKFCYECGAKLSRACPHCGAENLPRDKFCGECGRDIQQPEPAPTIDFNQPLSYTPKHLADKILITRSSIEGERKLVTVLFADVADSTATFGKLDPEQVHEIMDGCFRILMDEIHKYEGTINQFTGDGVMALFGAPIAHEDHAQRACHASLAIQKASIPYAEKLKRDYGIGFKMRIGLNTGPVVVGSIGDDLRMDYTAQGDTSHLASRMESTADPGTVLVSDNTYRLSRDFFEFESKGKVRVKGKEKDQEAYELLRPTRVETRIEAKVAQGLTKFVGRQRALRILQELFEKARSGSGQVAGIVGEAGVGKSRLLLEFVRSMGDEETIYIEGRCVHYGEMLSNYPFVEIVKKICRIKDVDGESAYREKLEYTVLGLDPALRGIIPFLQDLLSLQVQDKALAGLQPDQRKWKTIDAVKALLIRLSRQTPLVLALEDIHWIDKSSEELLTHLIDGLPTCRILLLCLYRPEYRHRWGELSYYSRLGVDQLSSAESAELVKAILEDSDVAPELSDLVLGKAGGNPLFVEEFTRNLLDVGVIARSGGAYVLTDKASEIPVPDTLQAVIAARIDRLDESLKRVMQSASVIGREFAFRVLQSIAEKRDELKTCLAILQGLEFIHEKNLFPELEYIFRHALTQEVAYNSLLIERRKEIHRRIGEAMEKLYAEALPEYLGPLAYHYYKGEAWDKAFKYLTAAGERARKTYATREAIGFLDKAVEVSRQIPDQVSKAQLARLHANRGKVRRMLMEYEKAAADFEKQAEIAEELGDKGQQWSALLSLASVHVWTGALIDRKKAEEYTEKALEIIRESGDVAGEMRWLLGSSATKVLGGELTSGISGMRRAYEMSKQLGQKNVMVFALQLLGIAHNFTGDFEACINECSESADLAREVGNQYMLLATYHGKIVGFGGKGEYDSAFEALKELERRAPELGSKRFIAMVHNHYGWLHRELCGFQEALLHDQQGVEVSRRLEDPECEMFSLLNLVGDHIDAGDYDTAQRRLDQVQEKRELGWYRERRWRYDMHFSRSASEIALANQEFPKAMRFAEDVLARGENTGSKKYIAFGWKLKGDVLTATERIEEALNCFEKARDLAYRMGYPPLMWKCQYALAGTYKELDKPEAMKAAFGEAATVIERMASNVSDGEIRETFLASNPVQALYRELEAL